MSDDMINVSTWIDDAHHNRHTRCQKGIVFFDSDRIPEIDVLTDQIAYQ